ncbi:MAG: cytochrome c [Syntrophotaleaceae bacterium]
MRHLLGNIAVYTIALFLLGAAALFGWLRSAQVVLTDEGTLLERFESAPARQFDWKQLGREGYMRNCANCHGEKGRGWDQYPGLAGIDRMLAFPGGREYLVDLHLYGLTSDRWGAPMPPMGHIRDAELAAIIDYILTRFGAGQIPDQKLFTPEDIEDRRGKNLSPSEVNARRPL